MVSSIVDLDSMVACEGGRLGALGLDSNGGEGERLGAQISKVKNCILYGFTWRIESQFTWKISFI